MQIDLADSDPFLEGETIARSELKISVVWITSLRYPPGNDGSCTPGTSDPHMSVYGPYIRRSGGRKYPGLWDYGGSRKRWAPSRRLNPPSPDSGNVQKILRTMSPHPGTCHIPAPEWLKNAGWPNSLSYARPPTQKRVLRVTSMIYKQLVITAPMGNLSRPRCIFRRPTLHIEGRSAQAQCGTKRCDATY